MNGFFQKPPIKLWDLVLLLFFSLAIIKLASLYWSVEDEQKDWEKFKAEKNCRLKLGEDGYESSTWVCDNGSVHYSWRQQR